MMAFSRGGQAECSLERQLPSVSLPEARLAWSMCGHSGEKKKRAQEMGGLSRGKATGGEAKYAASKMQKLLVSVQFEECRNRPTLPEDEGVVLAAVRSNAVGLKHASDELRSRPGLVRG